jgi:hypothetical protein
MNWFIKYFVINPLEGKLYSLKNSFKNYINSLLIGLIGSIFIIVCLFMIFIFAGLGLGTYINSLLYSSYLGFLIVAGIYIILAMLAWAIIKSSISRHKKN